MSFFERTYFMGRQSTRVYLGIHRNEDGRLGIAYGYRGGRGFDFVSLEAAEARNRLGLGQSPLARVGRQELTDLRTALGSGRPVTEFPLFDADQMAVVHRQRLSSVQGSTHSLMS
jgi:hypothetical protein